MDARKRGRAEFGQNGNGSFKKSKSEMDSLSGGIGSKSKPCTKFFSTSGCPFGDNCHFLHYLPGGYKAVAQIMNLAPPPRTVAPLPPPIQKPSTPIVVKTKICNKYNTAEGCKFGDKCNFAHGQHELGKPITPSEDNPHSIKAITARFGLSNLRPDPTISGPAETTFGISATANMSVDASFAGAIIGKGGVNSKLIWRQTGVKLAVREHESDPNLRNIALEGTFEQIQQASAMVREVIGSIGSAGGGGPVKAVGGGDGGGAPVPGSNYKTKLCERFANGSCTFGERCHFAHGEAELRKSGV